MTKRRNRRKSPAEAINDLARHEDKSRLAVDGTERVIDWSARQRDQDAVALTAMLLTADPDLAVRLPVDVDENFAETALISYAESGTITADPSGRFAASFGDQVENMWTRLAGGNSTLGTPIPVSLPSPGNHFQTVILDEIKPLISTYHPNATVVRISCAENVTRTQGAWAACLFTGINVPTSIGDVMKWPFAQRGTVNDLVGHTISLPILPTSSEYQGQISNRSGTSVYDVPIDGGNWQFRDVFDRYTPLAGSFDLAEAYGLTCSRIAFVIEGAAADAVFTVDVQRVAEIIPKVPFLNTSFPTMEWPASAPLAVQMAHGLGESPGALMDAPHNPSSPLATGAPRSFEGPLETLVKRSQADGDANQETFQKVLAESSTQLGMARKMGLSGDLSGGIAIALKVAGLLNTLQTPAVPPHQAKVLRSAAPRQAARSNALARMNRRPHEMGELATAIGSLNRMFHSIRDSGATREYLDDTGAVGRRSKKALDTILHFVDGATPVAQRIAPFLSRALMAFA